VTAFPLRLSLTSALLGITLGAQAAPAAITFDTTPRAGQHQRQNIDLQATLRMRAEPGPDASDEERAKIAQAAERMAQMGPMQMSMKMAHTLKVGQPDADGWLPLTVGTDATTSQMTVGGKAVPLPIPKDRESKFVARFNPRDFSFELQNIEGGSELSALLRAQGNAVINEALQLSKALSQRPMKLGDSVDVPLSLNLPMPLPGGAGSLSGQVHYQLARLDRGVAYFDMSMDLTADVSAPLPTPAGAPAVPAASAASAVEPAASAPAAPPKTMHIVIKGGGKGQSALRLADRLPLSSRFEMAMQMTMNMPDNGVLHADMDMTMNERGQSLATPAAAKKKP
jgi:hypothetical protein